MWVFCLNVCTPHVCSTPERPAEGIDWIPEPGFRGGCESWVLGRLVHLTTEPSLQSTKCFVTPFKLQGYVSMRQRHALWRLVEHFRNVSVVLKIILRPREINYCCQSLVSHRLSQVQLLFINYGRFKCKFLKSVYCMVSGFISTNKLKGFYQLCCFKVLWSLPSEHRVYLFVFGVILILFCMHVSVLPACVSVPAEASWGPWILRLEL